MNTNNLSVKANYELGYIIYSGLSKAIDDKSMSQEVLKELLDWYKANVILSYNSLEEKFNKVR